MSSGADDAIGSYAAVGDSFTEGVGDPGRDGAYIGWADRLAVLLSDRRAEGDFRYANLAVRGRLLDQIIAEQVPRARELAPDLVTFCAGGNDILRPGSDPDAVAERYEAAVADLRETVGTVLLCTGFDTRGVPVLRHLRGKIATYTAHVRAIADRHDCPVLDLWSLKSVQDRRAWSDDRLHLSADGHTGSRCAPRRCWGSTYRPTRTRRGRRRRSAPPPRRAGTTSTGRASTWSRGSAAACAASPPATTSSRSGPICCPCRTAMPHRRPTLTRGRRFQCAVGEPYARSAQTVRPRPVGSGRTPQLSDRAPTRNRPRPHSLSTLPGCTCGVEPPRP